MLKTFVIFLPGCEVVIKATHYQAEKNLTPASYAFYDSTETDEDGNLLRVALFPFKSCYGIIAEEYAVDSKPADDVDFLTNDEDEEDDKEF